MKNQLNIIVLAGGKGTRVKSILGETPKILAKINGISFIEYLEKWILSKLENTYKQIIIASGVGHEHIANYTEKMGKNWIIVREERLLGTLGAAANCVKQLRQAEADYLILNGDTLFEADLENAYNKFKKDRSNPLVIVKKTGNNERYGGYSLKGEMIDRTKKSVECISMGAVFAKGSHIIDMKDKAKESKIIMMDQHFIQKRECKAYVLEENAEFIDIGIPESYNRAQKYIPQEF